MDRARQAVSPGPPAGRERRSAPRAPALLEASYEDAERQFFVPTRDLSEGGIFLVAPDPPPTGVQARVTLELPGHPAILRLEGKVVRRSAAEPAGFAVQFDPEGVRGGARAALRVFIEAQRVPQGM